MKKINVCIAGGASTYTPGILVGMIKKLSTFPIKKLILFDNDEDRIYKMGEFAKVVFKDFADNVEVCYTTDPKVGFKDVDFVFCQIRTGGMKMREQDEKIPLNNNVIGQETCGAGGFAYGLRSIKEMIELVKLIRSESKNAWILNYTNPAAIIAIALEQVFPNDKRILNICDQPISLLMGYSRLLGNIDYKEMIPHYFGLNHFGWFTKIIDARNNEDITDNIKNKILKDGFAPADKEQRDKSWLVTYESVKTMLELDPTYLPSTYLQYYLIPQVTISHLDKNFTRANEVMIGREKRVFTECEEVIKSQTIKDNKSFLSEFDKKDAHGEMIVEIASSIYNNEGRPYIIIVKNDGLIDNLGKDMMVEVMCYLTKDGPVPTKVGEIQTYYKGLIEQQYAYERLTCDAYFEKSYLKALQALTLNRTIVDQKLAKKILDELISANKGYFPELL